MSRKFDTSPIKIEALLRELFDAQVGATHPIISLESRIYMGLCYALRQTSNDFSQVLQLLQYSVMVLGIFEDSLKKNTDSRKKLSDRTASAAYFGGKKYQPLQIIVTDILTQYIKEILHQQGQEKIIIGSALVKQDYIEYLNSTPEIITNKVICYFYSIEQPRSGVETNTMVDEFTPLLIRGNKK
jgi:hypothetical protein